MADKAKRVRSTRFRLLKPNKGDPFWKDGLWPALDETQRAANEMMTQIYLHEKVRYDYHNEHGEWPSDEQFDRFIKYQDFSKKYKLNSHILSMIYPQHPHRLANGGGYVCGIWKRLGRDVMYGNASLPTIRKGRIPFKAKSILSKNKTLKLEERDGDLWLPLPLGAKINLKSGEGWYWVRLATQKLDPSRKAILDHLRDGTYRCGDWELRWDKKNKLLEIIMSYSATNEDKAPDLNPKRILGVDLGIKQTKAAVSDSSHQIGFAALCEATSQLIETKRGIEARRKNILRRLNRPDVRHGHGRQAKYEPLSSLQMKWENFRHTWNHTLSRRIVDLAINQRCGKIALEDLRGDFTNTETFLGRNWPLHELWQMITYKANEVGIEVVFINPAYTSRRCSECGYIDNEFTFDFRKKANWPKFKCPKCGWESDADFNAARNIANPKVEGAIKRQLVRQGLKKSDNPDE